MANAREDERLQRARGARVKAVGGENSISDSIRLEPLLGKVWEDTASAEASGRGRGNQEANPVTHHVQIHEWNLCLDHLFITNCYGKLMFTVLTLWFSPTRTLPVPR